MNVDVAAELGCQSMVVIVFVVNLLLEFWRQALVARSVDCRLDILDVILINILLLNRRASNATPHRVVERLGR